MLRRHRPKRAEDFASCERNERRIVLDPFQVSHLKHRRPITFSFLARHAKSSALLAFPRCTAAGLMFHENGLCSTVLMFHAYVPGPLMFHRLMFQGGAYVPRNRLMFHRTIGRDAPGPPRCPTRRAESRKLSRFSRDTKDSQPRWCAPDVQLGADLG